MAFAEIAIIVLISVFASLTIVGCMPQDQVLMPDEPVNINIKNGAGLKISYPSGEILVPSEHKNVHIKTVDVFEEKPHPTLLNRSKDDHSYGNILTALQSLLEQANSPEKPRDTGNYHDEQDYKKYKPEYNPYYYQKDHPTFEYYDMVANTHGDSKLDRPKQVFPLHLNDIINYVISLTKNFLRAINIIKSFIDLMSSYYDIGNLAIKIST